MVAGRNVIGGHVLAVMLLHLQPSSVETNPPKTAEWQVLRLNTFPG